MPHSTLSDSLRAVEAEIAAGQPEHALALCHEIQSQHPRALAVQRVLGEIYLALRKTRDAIGALDRALAGNPEDARACCARAIVQQIQGDSAGALGWYRRACDIRPDDQVLRSAYRELATHMGRPAYIPTRIGLARLYLRGDLFPHAIREWETILSVEPDSLTAQVGLVETLWRGGYLEAAADRARRILANSPACVKALLILALIELDAGNIEEAQRLVRRVSELDPDQRIASDLFADRLGSGDRQLRTLLFGEEAARTDTAVPQKGARTGALPAQFEEFKSTLQPQTAPPAPTDTAVERANPRTTSPLSASRPTSGNLPPDFHSIFTETEYMLWGKDSGEHPRPATGGRTAPLGAPAIDPFRQAPDTMPPAMREQGMSLQDTESRQALNFLTWLQAQGALSHGTGSPGGTGPLPPMEYSTALGLGLATGSREPGSRPPLTGPLPPPSPDALRAMFAELGTDTSRNRVVEGNIVPPSGGESTAELAWSASEARDMGWTVDEAATEPSVETDEREAFADVATSDLYTPPAPEVTQPTLSEKSAREESPDGGIVAPCSPSALTASSEVISS